jgi:uncharacterized membrane protein
MIPGLTRLFAYLGISDGLGIFLIFVILAHIIAICVLFVKTRNKADKWKERKKRLQFKKTPYAE